MRDDLSSVGRGYDDRSRGGNRGWRGRVGSEERVDMELAH